jgi:hypothetical protein
MRISYDPSAASTNIYKNGVAVGTERTSGTTTWLSYSQSLQYNE